MIFYERGWNTLRNGGIYKYLKGIQWKRMGFVDLFCLGIVFTTQFEHLHSLFHVNLLFNTNKIM